MRLSCVTFSFFHVAHLFRCRRVSIDSTPALSSPAQTENGSGNEQSSSKAIRKRPPVFSGGGGGPGGSFKLGKPMKLQRIVSQSPAEDFETLTAEAPPQRSRSDPMASVSTGGGGMGDRGSTARAPRKFDDKKNDKPGFTTSGGRYAWGKLAKQRFWMWRWASCARARLLVHWLLCVRL